MRSEFDPAEHVAGDDAVDIEVGAALPPEHSTGRKGKGRGAARRRGRGAGVDGNTGRGRGIAKWDYTGWEKWLKVDEDVNDPKDIANAKSRMRKAAAKSAFKAKKGQKWFLLV